MSFLGRGPMSECPALLPCLTLSRQQYMLVGGRSTNKHVSFLQFKDKPLFTLVLPSSHHSFNNILLPNHTFPCNLVSSTTIESTEKLLMKVTEELTCGPHPPSQASCLAWLLWLWNIDLLDASLNLPLLTPSLFFPRFGSFVFSSFTLSPHEHRLLVCTDNTQSFFVVKLASQLVQQGWVLNVHFFLGQRWWILGTQASICHCLSQDENCLTQDQLCLFPSEGRLLLTILSLISFTVWHKCSVCLESSFFTILDTYFLMNNLKTY